MHSNQQLMTFSVAFENSSTPFKFYQTNIITEPDRAFIPYTNWFRGDYTSCFPIIADREAGFYPRKQTPITTCHLKKTEEEDTKTDHHCYRGATQQMRRCYKVNKDNQWVQTDPSYLSKKPIMMYI